MYINTLVILGILKITIAFHPVIFQKDNSVIATEPIKVSQQQHLNIIPVNYPYYEVGTNQSLITPTKELVTTKSDSLPADLLEIARSKLGIQNLDKIPSLSELGNLLGTTTRKETIEAIRELTATESGIDLIKAFIESSDYKDDLSDKNEHIQSEAESIKSPESKNVLSETAEKDLEIIQKVLSTPQQDLGFFERFCLYLNVFDLFPENKKIPVLTDTNEVDQIKHKVDNKHHESHHQRHPKLQPISVTNRFPNSNPVSYRPGTARPTVAPATYRSIRDNQRFPELKALNISLEERFLN